MSPVRAQESTRESMRGLGGIPDMLRSPGHTASEPPPQTVVSKVGPQTWNVTTNAKKKKKVTKSSERRGKEHLQNKA